MSFFSPISKRSPSVRVLLNGIYVLLAAGALTMILPLMITFSASMSGVYDLESVSFYPKFLVSDKALWSRYVDARYGGDIENFKMAWSDPSLDFYNPPTPSVEAANLERLKLWDEFVATKGLTPNEAGLAFTRTTRRDAALENREFRIWLMAQYGNNLDRLNADLLLEVTQATEILPPRQSRISLVDVETPLQNKLAEYLVTLPSDRRLAWDVGGYYRAVYLPRLFGEDVAAYNSATGTSFSSYSEVPFPATVPEVGEEPWIRFVREMLNPGLVNLTPDGEKAL